MFVTAGAFEEICELLDYRFEKPALLAQALTRQSWLNENKQALLIGNNERLEFFGDSIVRMVIDDFLMELYPTADEGDLSEERNKWVSKDGFLSQTFEKLDFGKFTRMGKGERSNYEGDGKTKIAADIMEAIIGAIFLDSKRDYVIIKQFIGKHSGLSERITAYKDRQLFDAVKALNLSQVKHWLTEGANPNAVHEYSYEISDPVIVNSELVYLYNDTVTKSTALDLAIRRINGCNLNTDAIVEELLKHGANPNHKGDFRYSLLHDTIFSHFDISAQYQSFNNITSLLCQYGAQPNICCRILLSTPTPLALAVMVGNVEQVKTLLNYEADPNLQDNLGRTVLHLACISYEIHGGKPSHGYYINRENYLTIIRDLLASGANPTIEDEHGNYPSDYTENPSIKRMLNSPNLVSASSYQSVSSAASQASYSQSQSNVSNVNFTSQQDSLRRRITGPNEAAAPARFFQPNTPSQTATVKKQRTCYESCVIL